MPDSYRNFPEATAAPDAASVITAAQEQPRLRTNNRPNCTTKNSSGGQRREDSPDILLRTMNLPERAGKVFCKLKIYRIFAKAPSVLAVNGILVGRKTMF